MILGPNSRSWSSIASSMAEKRALSMVSLLVARSSGPSASNVGWGALLESR